MPRCCCRAFKSPRARSGRSGNLSGTYSHSASPSEFLYALGGPYFIGIITVVLAVLGAVFRQDRVTEVLAFGVVVAVTAAIAFVPLLESLLRELPTFGKVHWFEAADPMGFALAALARCRR